MFILWQTSCRNITIFSVFFFSVQLKRCFPSHLWRLSLWLKGECFLREISLPYILVHGPFMSHISTFFALWVISAALPLEWFVVFARKTSLISHGWADAWDWRIPSLPFPFPLFVLYSSPTVCSWHKRRADRPSCSCSSADVQDILQESTQGGTQNAGQIVYCMFMSQCCSSKVLKLSSA